MASFPLFSRATAIRVSEHCRSDSATRNAGIVWFDAHGDFHTPETTISGSVEGMSLALATNDSCAENRVVLAGARDLDPVRTERVKSRLLHCPSAILRPRPCPICIPSTFTSTSMFSTRRSRRGVTSRGPAVHDALSSGESFESIPCRGLAITNYNPDRDPQNRTRDIVVAIIEHIHGCAGRLRTTLFPVASK